ncbi:MAG: N-acetyl-gamma-glutamyl-phosphate reductase [Spirochaetes bacterium]|jgi:N-acetyl-gamma-glutamyl-phosphate reductase|nr:N-acetyl-gamma-glutamyl-phosphate reductase [Spirochaetota bacterium]
MRAVVLGATGYTGQVLISLLLDHPDVTEIVPVSSSRAGEPVARVLPKISQASASVIDGGPAADGANANAAWDAFASTKGCLVTIEEAASEKADVVFSCLPHLTSAELLTPFYGTAVIIDLSADFRIPDAERFRAGYGQAPPREDLLGRSVYGLSELAREAVRGADIIANPGCYPTGILLALLPLVSRGIVGTPAVANAMSGVTGAGKKVQEGFLFTEVDESTKAYSPGKSHRHWYEMDHYLQQAQLAGAAAPGDGAGDLRAGAASTGNFLFLPHLVPMRRGIAASIVTKAKSGAGDSEIAAAYDQAYGGAPFIRVNPAHIPTTADVVGSNRCDISWRIEGDSVLLFSCIDNLLKGAAGQAVQNMNLRFGLGETAGLPRRAAV